MMTVDERCEYLIDAFGDGECVFEFVWQDGMNTMYVRRGWYGKDGLFEVDLGSLYGPDAELDVPHWGVCTWQHVKEAARFYVQRLLIDGQLTKGGK